MTVFDGVFIGAALTIIGIALAIIALFANFGKRKEKKIFVAIGILIAIIFSAVSISTTIVLAHQYKWESDFFGIGHITSSTDINIATPEDLDNGLPNGGNTIINSGEISAGLPSSSTSNDDSASAVPSSRDILIVSSEQYTDGDPPSIFIISESVSDFLSVPAPVSSISEMPVSSSQGMPDISADGPPLLGHGNHWALANLICAIVSLGGGAVALIVGAHRKKDDEEEKTYKNEPQEEEGRKKGNRLWPVLGAVSGVASPIVFFLTENMRLPMAIFDKWTPVMVAFLLAQGIFAVLQWNTKRKKEEDEYAGY